LQKQLDSDPKDWKRFAWYLERIFPDQYADKTKSSVAVLNQVNTAAAAAPVDKELLDKLSARMERCLAIERKADRDAIERKTDRQD
jgi:hypothetical protein